MEGLRQERTRLRTRRARYSHARTVARGKGEGLPRHATVGHPWSVCVGGGSTAFSGDRAQRARRKAVDASETLYPGGAGAPAPVGRPCDHPAPWRSVAAVCARVTVELARRCAGGGSTTFSGDRAQRARRKVVDAPEAPDPEASGASAPVPKHNPFLAPGRPPALVRARVIADLGRYCRRPPAASGRGLWRELVGAAPRAEGATASPADEPSGAPAGEVGLQYREPWPGP